MNGIGAADRATYRLRIIDVKRVNEKLRRLGIAFWHAVFAAAFNPRDRPVEDAQRHRDAAELQGDYRGWWMLKNEAALVLS
jgi:hypothetical protein